MSSRGLPVTKEIRARRRKEAEARQAEYDKLTLQQKLAALPPEPFAAKQRSKLLAKLEEVNNGEKQTSTPSLVVDKNLRAKERRVKERKQ